MPLNVWDEDKWRDLIDALQQKSCILLLGPDTAGEEVDEKSQPFSKILAYHLLEDFNQRIKQDDNIIKLAEVSQYYSAGMGRINLEKTVCSFYEQRRPLCSQFHLDLAALPFYFVITASPDYMFYEALKQNNKMPIVTRYHFKGKNPSMVQMGTVERPLLFYLYGTIDEPDSLVLTENDSLNFKTSIISKKPLPDRIISELQAPDKSFLFLGSDLKQWYLDILPHILTLSGGNNLSFALEEFKSQYTNELKYSGFFFQQNANTFHSFKNNLNEFAKELKKRYEEITFNAGGTTPDELKKAPRVFICHANEDREQAANIYKKMRLAGLKPWLDKENLRVGEHWDEVIKKAIKKEIDYFLVLQSNQLVNKIEGYVNKEIYEARERQKEFRSGIRFIIPVKIEDCDLLEELEELQAFDLTDEKKVDDLIRIIKRDFMRRGKR